MRVCTNMNRIMTSPSSPPPDVLTVLPSLVGHLHDDEHENSSSSDSFTSPTCTGHLSSPPRRSTAISYECSSLKYFAALLEDMNNNDDVEEEVFEKDNSTGNADNIDNMDSNDGSNVRQHHRGNTGLLESIQGQLLEKHVQNGTLRPRTIGHQGTAEGCTSGRESSTSSSSSVSSTTASRIRRRQRPVRQPIQSRHETRCRVVYSFRGEE